MAERCGSPMTRQVHQFVALSGDVPASDASLLREFIQRRDESAFAALVRRHGPMVLGVCRRILRQAADADDAFQAVFVLLARKASSIARPELLANWLYGVALRTAWEARRRQQRQRRLEQPLADQAVAADRIPDLFDWRAILDREISRLPDKYRAPVVLCELQGRSRKEVAQLLGIPEGTLSSRLAAARQRLADRLRRRGVAVTGSALASILAEHGAADSLAAPLLQAAIHSALNSQATPAVLHLTQGVLMILWLKQLKTYTALSVGLLLGVALLGYGGGMFGIRGQVRAEDNPKTKPTDAKATPTDNPLLGGWRVVKLEVAGRTSESAPDAPETLFFTSEKVVLRNRVEGLVVAKYTWEPSKKTSLFRVVLDLPSVEGGKVVHCIAEIKGDEGKLGTFEGGPRDKPPESFDQADRDKLMIMYLRRDPQLKEPDAQTLAEAERATRERAEQMRSMDQLKRIALAMHNYADSLGGVPR
ncbi:MAG: sigma-70 family RNA polymerase sigma factor, partial [Gemmataceae bacterium]|nr:sigma-70 family RNA polymerase sigma factor [Gemmataceae bacterium]